MVTSNKQLMFKICNELPRGSIASSFILLNAIRVWCYENIPYTEDVAKTQDNILKDGKYVYYDVWSHKQLFEIYNDFDKKGFWCGGHARFLCEVYKLFGYTSNILNFGYPQNSATHVVTTVDYGYGFFIQDCTMDAVSLNSYEDIEKIINTYGKTGLKEILYVMYDNPNKNVSLAKVKPADYQTTISTMMTKLVYEATGINDFKAIFLHKL